MPNDPLEAGRAMGLSRPSILMNIVIPENGNHLLSQLMFMFEYNVRHGTVIGIVGAGGIGYYISTYLKFLQYDKVFALLILIFIVVVLIDLLSLAVRSFVNEEGDVRKPTWLNMLIRSTKAGFRIRSLNSLSCDVHRAIFVEHLNSIWDFAGERSNGFVDFVLLDLERARSLCSRPRHILKIRLANPFKDSCFKLSQFFRHDSTKGP
jgi:hypothetical protein